MREERRARPNRLAAIAVLSALLPTGCGSPPAGADGWSHYGASLRGDRHAAPSAITPESVEHLSLAWIYRTGDANDGRDFDGNPSRLQATPAPVRGLRHGRGGGSVGGNPRVPSPRLLRDIAARGGRRPCHRWLRHRRQRGGGGRGRRRPRAQHTEQDGTPYGMARFKLLHNGLPCLEGPWSTLVAVDLDLGEVLWERPLGASEWGSFTSGGPMVTEGGVVFQASTSDHMLRGYSGADGSELWARELPAGAHATPMGYRHGGMDYVVVAAGDGLAGGGGRGDHVIAFRMAADPQ